MIAKSSLPGHSHWQKRRDLASLQCLEGWRFWFAMQRKEVILRQYKKDATHAKSSYPGGAFGYYTFGSH
jgi:hypothetical protein